MDTTQWIALGVFVATYALIISERLHRLTAALAGLSGVLLLQLVEQSEAFSFIDFNTIGLLLGMMILVGVVKKTGLIELAAIRTIRLSGGKPWRLLVLLSVLTALISALLDNVTTILLIGPVALAVCESLDLDPIPFCISLTFASNIGGTATLIGDPPNILIGSAAGLSFNAFLLNLGPAVLVSLAVTFGLLYLFYRKDLEPDESTAAALQRFRDSRQRVDPVLTPRVLAILGLVLGAFLLHRVLHLEAATIALAGATLALVLCPVNVEEMVAEVDWVTLLFFSALFMLVGTLEHLGLIEAAATLMVNQVGDSPKLLALLLVWGSGILSAVVDNVPYTAAVIPLVRDVAHLSGMDPTPLWWSLALGACFGGNGTLVGASANLVMAGLAEKGGISLRFGYFLKVGIPVTAATLLASTVYVYLRYLI